MKHICGQCNKEFKSEEGYLKHLCEITGRKPTEPEISETKKVEVPVEVEPEEG